MIHSQLIKFKTN